jgi:hypothetical protein
LKAHLSGINPLVDNVGNEVVGTPDVVVVVVVAKRCS